MSAFDNITFDYKSTDRIYIAIDLKSFYASVECVERGLDALKTNLVVADLSRTEKTICLAVSPTLKAFGIPGRARLFEVVQKIREVNDIRLRKLRGRSFTGKSSDANELNAHNDYEVDYIVAKPRMALYMKYSTDIYNIYLKFIAPEDIHVYSVDEVFIDVTDYLDTYKLTPEELASKLVREVYDSTGITATAGIGTNLYLCKVAMDIVAKHIPADEHGVRIAQLDEMNYRRLLWGHKPITDFWRVGKGYANRLAEYGMYTMGDVARCSVGKASDYYNEDLLYKLFGVNAELLIDHAWGYEPCTISMIKNYKPEAKSISLGQVLSCPYDVDKAKIIVREMTEALVLEMVEKGYVTDQMVINLCYDVENLSEGMGYSGELSGDRYGRQVPKPAHGTANLKSYTSSTKLIMEAVLSLYDRIMDRNMSVRKIYIIASHIISEKEAEERKKTEYVQLDLFTDYETLQREKNKQEEELKKERRLQEAMLDIKNRFGKNAILKGTNFREGATAIERNSQIGGHKA